MPALSVRIQAHPSREELLPALLESLAPLPTTISYHASDPPNPWAGYKQALTDLPECSHLLVLQDDVLLCRNFPPAVEQIAEAKPNEPVCLFLGGLPRGTSSDALRALKRGSHYVRLRLRDFCPVVGVLWPRHKAEELMAWTVTDPYIPGYPNAKSDDAVIGKWMMVTRQLIWATCPSLVQHPDNVPSIIGRRAAWGKDKGRVALQFCEGDPLDINWS